MRSRSSAACDRPLEGRARRLGAAMNHVRARQEKEGESEVEQRLERGVSLRTIGRHEGTGRDKS